MLSYWSVQREDLKKLLPLCFIIFCLAGYGSFIRKFFFILGYNYLGAQSLETLKLDWAIVPFSIVYIFFESIRHKKILITELYGLFFFASLRFYYIFYIT
jgi:hypothetical protein